MSDEYAYIIMSMFNLSGSYYQLHIYIFQCSNNKRKQKCLILGCKAQQISRVVSTKVIALLDQQRAWDRLFKNCLVILPVNQIRRKRTNQLFERLVDISFMSLDTTIQVFWKDDSTCIIDNRHHCATLYNVNLVFSTGPCINLI